MHAPARGPHPQDSIPHHQCQVVDFIGGLSKTDGLELSKGRIERNFSCAFNQAFMGQTMLDEVSDGHQHHVVLLRQFHQLRQPCHAAVFVHDFDNDTGRFKTGQPCKVHCGLCVTGAAQHTPGLGAQREDVTRLAQGIRRGGRINQRLDGFGTVAGGNPCGASVPHQIHRNGEWRFKGSVVRFDHQVKTESVASRLEHGGTNEAATMRGHKVDDFGRSMSRGDEKIPFVFSILVVHHDDDFTALDGFDGLWDGVQLRHGTKVHR